ncbi:MAG: hypothetical protein AB7O92_00570 [Acidimicrobiia bacterium]
MSSDVTSTAVPGRPIAPEVQQQRDRLRDAMVLLEDALAAPSAVRFSAWSFSAVAATDSIRAALHRHQEVTEAPDGLLRDIVAAAPQLEHAVAAVREEHDAIEQLLEQLAVAVSALPEGQDLPITAVADSVEHVRRIGRELLALLVHHRQKGIELTYQAFSSDLGSGD